MIQTKTRWQKFGAFFLATLIVVAATALQIFLKPHVEQIAFILLYPAIMLSAYFLPLPASLFALFLSCLSFIFLFSTFTPLGYLDHAEFLRLAVFIASGAMICILIARGNRINTDLNSTLRRLENVEYAIDSSSIVAITDNKGVIKYVNDQFCQISKYTEEELLGKTHRIINSGFHPPEFFERLWKTISSGQVWKGEILNRAKDGSLYWVDTVITPLMDEFGKPQEYIAIRNDITHRKKTEESLKAAIETRDRFLSIASHELKTPLTSMKLKMQMFLRQLEKNQIIDREKTRLLAEGEVRQIDNLERLVNDMLDISRINTGRLQYNADETELCELVKRAVDNTRLLLDKFGTEVDIECREKIIGIWDTQRLEQVVLNLLSNAARYGKKKPIKVIVGKDINWAFITVIDQGIGIAPADQERIFKQFERAINHHEVSGLGLGLYISKKIIDAHDGKLIVESELGKGSKFTVYLPHDNQIRKPVSKPDHPMQEV